MNLPAAGLLVTFGVMTILVTREAGMTPRRSLSQHISKSPRAITYGKVGLTLGGVLFVAALVEYAHIGWWFVAATMTAACLGTAVAYLPYDVSRRQDFWHDVFSYGYVVMNPIILLTIWTVLPNGGLKLAYAVGIALQLLLIMLLIAIKPARRFFLFGQILFLSIFASLLTAS